MSIEKRPFTPEELEFQDSVKRKYSLSSGNKPTKQGLAAYIWRLLMRMCKENEELKAENGELIRERPKAIAAAVHASSHKYEEQLKEKDMEIALLRGTLERLAYKYASTHEVKNEKPVVSSSSNTCKNCGAVNGCYC